VGKGFPFVDGVVCGNLPIAILAVVSFVVWSTLLMKEGKPNCEQAGRAISPEGTLNLSMEMPTVVRGFGFVGPVCALFQNEGV
jgi:hypothetical protein